MLPTSALNVIHVLLNTKKSLSLREFSREAQVSLSRCSRYINELERLGYVRRRPRIKVINEEMVYLIAYARPLKSLKMVNFEALERPEYLIKKIAELAADELSYAYTHLAG
ncbi:MAG: MarR family transcriptional regulator, partial [Candidatus Bathyarchaeia archaeon]